MTEKELNFEKQYNYLICNGEYYEWDAEDGKPILKHVDKNFVEKKLEKAKEIAQKIKEGLDAEAVIIESLMNFREKDLDKLYNLVNSQTRKYKPKTRKHHCVDMKVGKFIIPIN